MGLRFFAIAAAIILLAAIAVCSLTSSPSMSELPFIPTWLGTWADRNGNFRNFPVFAALSAVLFLLFNTSHAGLPRRISEKVGAASREGGFVVTFNQVGRRGDLSRQASVLVTRYGRWRLAFGAFLATALLGASLEVAQLLFLSNRHFDWADIGWSTSGAFVGALGAALVSRVLSPQA